MKYLLLLLPFIINAQSVFVDDNAFYTSVSALSFNDVTTVGFDLGYSFQGRTDFGVGLSTSSNSGLTELDIRSSISHLLIKQDDYTPVSFAAGIGYTYAKISGLTDLDASGNALNLGVGLYHSYEASERVSLIPHFILQYNTGDITVKDSFGNQFDIGTTGMTYQIGSTLLLDLRKGKFGITPALIFSEGKSGFAIQFHYIP